MTKLLNRGNVFVVVRSFTDAPEPYNPTAVGVFSELDEADDYKGMCEQQWKERYGVVNVVFDIQLTTYYGK